MSKIERTTFVCCMGLIIYVLGTLLMTSGG
jgi:hypothetical protein